MMKLIRALQRHKPRFLFVLYEQFFVGRGGYHVINYELVPHIAGIRSR